MIEKSCLVTGAASGIGRATALLLARSGARVTAADINAPGVEALRTELAAHGIRVNAVAPGTIRTERVIALEDEPGGPEYLSEITGAHPMGRLGEPEEVSRVIAFLASDAASFVTGAIVPVDGGYPAR